MQDFKDYIVEDKNTHLEHLEDEIINNGTEGAKTAIEFLKSIKQMLQGGEGGSQISVKWDGAPAIFCGINPENGKFFVATKSLFNATPKINYTNADIKRNHGGALADKLTVALKFFPKLGIQGVLQGDLLFTSGDKSRVKVDGKDSIVFTPNTITYAVPVVKTGFLGSSLYKRVNSAKIGIIFHTSYTGNTIKGLTANFGASVTNLKKSKDVFFDDAMYKQTNPGFTRTEAIAFDNIIRMAEGSAYKAGAFIDKIKKDKNTLSLGVQLKTFFNTYIREGIPITNTKVLVNNFEVYFKQKIQKEIDSKKQESTKQKYEEIREVGMRIIRADREGLYFAIATYITFQSAKAVLMKKLNNIQSIGSFLRTKDGFKVTNPEGYVAIKQGGAVKLVDRLEFSRANFNMAKNWVKDNQMAEEEKKTTTFHPADTNGDGTVSKEEHQMYMEFKRKELEDADAMRDAQRTMTWFALAGLLLYPFAVVLAVLAGLDSASKILGDMAATYFVAVAGIVAAFFGSQAYSKKK